MKNDIYKTLSKPKKPDIYKREKKDSAIVAKVKVVNPQRLPKTQKVILVNKEDLLEVFKTAFDELKEVRISNQYEAPEIQKVELRKDQVAPPVEFPEVQTVKVENVSDFPKTYKKVVIENIGDFPKVRIPTKFNIDNMPEFPFGEADIPGKADPTKYLNVRLTNGKEFYNALKDFWVSAGKGSPNASGGSSGGGVVTSLSGTLHATVDNFPTVQTVYLQNSPSVTSLSGMFHTNVDNFPNTFTVIAQYLPPVTSISGSFHSVIDNFPTIQTVNVQNMPPITTISGTVSSPLPLPVFGQVKVTVSGTAVQFPTNTLQNGITVTAHIDNLASVVIGKSGLTYQLDGTGNGDELPPGASRSFAIPNSNLLWLNGGATDFITFNAT